MPAPPPLPDTRAPADAAQVGHLLESFDRSAMLLPADALHRFLASLDARVADMIS